MEIKQAKKNYLYFLAALLLGFSLAWAAFYLAPIRALQAEQAPAKAQEQAKASPVGTGIVADTVAKTSPAVVLIETTATGGGRGYDPFFNDPFFRDFFGNRVPLQRAPEVSSGMGSGFIISSDGYILTNEHVVAGADTIQVTLTGKDKPLPAKLLGSDQELDLAVLKIEEENLPFLELGDSDNVRVGEWVIAIGNPHGLDHTVTVGVISAKGRPVTVQDRQYKNLLQTDASINPGNSGGPLINMQGQVVGINTAVNASAQGIGFAISANTVKPVLETLKASGKISRPWLGVYIQTVDQEIAQYLGMDKVQGVAITNAVKGGPAERAGLKQGDVILEINNVQTNDAQGLTAQVESLQVGQKVTLLVFRQGKTINVSVDIGEKGVTG